MSGAVDSSVEAFFIAPRANSTDVTQRRTAQGKLWSTRGSRTCWHTLTTLRLRETCQRRGVRDRMGYEGNAKGDGRKPTGGHLAGVHGLGEHCAVLLHRVPHAGRAGDVGRLCPTQRADALLSH